MFEQILIAKDIYREIIIGKNDVEALENNVLLLFKRNQKTLTSMIE
ncbi:hypothetical protein [Geminocystis herdmanii]|nr:hypothetical protein [Geminocystis herdmanii]